MDKWQPAGRGALAVICVIGLGATFGLASAQDATEEAAPAADDEGIAASALPERRDAPNPTAEHVAFMATLDAIGEATVRANALESAQRLTAGVELWYGIPPEGAR